MAEPTDRPADPGAPDGADATPRPRRVLVVEEDRVEGGMLAFHLRREGLIVMLMAGEDEAIDAVAWAPPDAILVEKSGRDLDAFRVIRALGDAPVLVYLIADGPLSLEDDLEALRLGVADIFTKPLDPAQVAARLGARPLRPPRPRPAEVPEDGIAGDLELHPVTSLLQFCHRHRMNARVHVEMANDWGVLLIRHGDVIDAESPNGSGRSAAYEAISSANEGTFVMFPLALDAEELSRDDVVRADLATLVTEAFNKQAAQATADRQVAKSASQPPLQHADSPRGPLSRQTPRTTGPKKNETLEYPAVRSDDAGKDSGEGDGRRARVRKQVGIPSVETDAAPPEPEQEGKDAPAGRAAKRRRVPSDIAKKTSRAPTNPTAKPMEDEASTPGTEHSTKPTVIGSIARPGGGDGEPPQDAIRTLKNAEAPTDEMLEAAVAAAREEQQQGLEGKLTRNGGAREVLEVRGDHLLTAEEPGFDEPTDVNAKNPIKGPRVRRGTGQYAIGDPDAPDEATAHNLDPIEEDTHHRLARKSGPPLLLVALAVLLLAAVVFVGWRLATKGGDDTATIQAPPAKTLTAEERSLITFGEAVQAQRAGKLDAAEAQFTTLVKSGSQPDQVLSGLAAVYYDQGRFEEAEHLLEDLTRSQPESPRLLAYLGVVYAKQGKIEDARHALEQAIDISDDGPLKREIEAALGAVPEPAPTATP